MKYELKLQILDKNYVDQLITALVRQGYAVYYHEDENVVCFTITDDEITKLEEINEKKI